MAAQRRRKELGRNITMRHPKGQIWVVIHKSFVLVGISHHGWRLTRRERLGTPMILRRTFAHTSEAARFHLLERETVKAKVLRGTLNVPPREHYDT